MIGATGSGLLKASLAQWLASPPLWGGGPTLREPTRTIKAAQQVEKTFAVDKPVAPAPFDLERIRARVAEAWQGRNLESLSLRERRSIPWILYFPDGKEAEWLGLNNAFLRAFGKLLGPSPSKRTLVNLLYVFLQSARPDHVTYETIRQGLRGQILETDGVGLALWRGSCAAYGLLEKDRGSALRRAVDGSGLAIADALREAGLAPGLERSQVVREAVIEILRETGDRLGRQSLTTSELAYGFEWLQHENGLRFDDLRVETARMLLAPFVGKPIPKEMGEALRKFFVSCLGDPRFPSATGWFGVPAEHKTVILRLLVELTLDDFFKVFGTTAKKKQWVYREKFWKAYVDFGAVEDARVVLGPNARKIAPGHLDASTIRSSSELTGGGGDGRQSVLLLRFHTGLVVAEWSHNGKCRFWLPSKPHAPRLGKAAYERKELDSDGKPDHEVSHHGAAYGSWQSGAAEWIWERTQIYLPPESYMP